LKYREGVPKVVKSVSQSFFQLSVFTTRLSPSQLNDFKMIFFYFVWRDYSPGTGESSDLAKKCCTECVIIAVLSDVSTFC